MQVYAWVKHKEYPDSKKQEGMQSGDICYIYPIDAGQGRLTQKTYFPVVIDIEIPCGKDFSIINGVAQWKCGRCEYNDPELCDVRKYMSAEWGPGDILNPPPLLKKRRYTIDIDSVTSEPIKELILKENKTESEINQVTDYAKNNSKQKTVISLKEDK